MGEYLSTVLEIREETHDVKTFRLRPAERIAFTPGQYCIVSFVGNQSVGGESRPLTFASSPTDESVELTVKRMGGFTTAMHDLKQGDKLLLNGPSGESLNFDESVKEDVVFIAGGSGITPFISALRYAVAKGLPNSLTLLFGNRSEKDIIFRSELEELGKRNNISIIHALSDEKPENWRGEFGRINKEMIERHIQNPDSKLWYVCGPPPMMRAMDELLLSMGIPKERIREESWQLPGKSG